MNQKQNILGLDRTALQTLMASQGGKPFHGRQLMKWLYRHGVDDFSAMTDLSKSIRQWLLDHCEIRMPKIVAREHSEDGTRKWLLDVNRSQMVETVYIPEGKRATLCISSQVGCALDCAFCATAQGGFNRNLTSAEIIAQVVIAQTELTREDPDARISNVVFMGMGEPLANYREVVSAARILTDDFGFDLSRRRVTVSTSGIVPRMRQLALDVNVALAVSLHAPNDELRDQLVPINKRYPLKQLLGACWYYLEQTKGRSVTFEYVMLNGINDSLAEARALVKLLKGKPAKVNLIPFNPFPGTRFTTSPDDVIDRFQSCLHFAGIRTTTRRTRGADISAACGQLAGQVANRIETPLSTRPKKNEVCV